MFQLQLAKVNSRKKVRVSSRWLFLYFCHSGGAQSAKPVDPKSYVTDEQQQQQVGDERGAIVEPEHDVLVLFEDKQIE